MSHSHDAHKKLYKKTPTVEEAQERRRVKGFTIRKERRDALLASKRHCRSSGNELPSSDDDGVYHYDLAAAQRHNLEQLQQAVAILQQTSQPLDVRRAALESVRQCLCSDEPPVEAAIELGVVPFVIEFLQRPDHQAQVDAAWCITNLAATDAPHLTQAVVPSLPILVSLLSSSLPELQEQCAWALGNIAGDNAALRNAVVAAGAIPALMHLGISAVTRTTLTFENSLLSPSRKPRVEPCSLSQVEAPLHGESTPQCADSKLLSTVVFALCNLAKGDSEHHEQLIRSGAVTLVLRLLLHPEARVVSEAACAAAYLSTTGIRGCEPFFLHSYEQVFGVEHSPISGGGGGGAWPEIPVVAFLLVSLLDYIHHESLVVPVLRTIGNIVCSSSANVQALCSDPRFLQLLANALQYSMFIHVKYVARCSTRRLCVTDHHHCVSWQVRNGLRAQQCRRQPPRHDRALGRARTGDLAAL